MLLQLNELIEDIRKSSVSIPQAVSAVATVMVLVMAVVVFSFNTASGKCCCNDGIRWVNKVYVNTRFNTASGKCCCNSEVWKASIYAVPKCSFGKPQTVNGNFLPH